MVVVCPNCREVVHLLAGYIQRHGFTSHGAFHACSSSGTPYVSCSSCCDL